MFIISFPCLFPGSRFPFVPSSSYTKHTSVRPELPPHLRYLVAIGSVSPLFTNYTSAPVLGKKTSSLDSA